MAEIINWQEEDRRHTGLAWALIEIIADAPKVIANAISAEAKDPLKVKLTINGREVRFSTVIDRLLQQHDRMVKEEAAEMLLEKKAALVEAVGEVFKRFAADHSSQEDSE